MISFFDLLWELLWWLRWSRIHLQCRGTGLIPGLGRSPGEGHGNNPLQYSCLGNPMDRGVSLSMIISRSIHVAANSIILFFFFKVSGFTFRSLIHSEFPFVHHWLLYVDFVSCNFTEFVVVLTVLGFCMYNIASSANSVFFLSNLHAFYLSCLTALARTSRTMLNSSGESGHLCLVPDLKGKLSVFHCWVY